MEDYFTHAAGSDKSALIFEVMRHRDSNASWFSNFDIELTPSEVVALEDELVNGRLMLTQESLSDRSVVFDEIELSPADVLAIKECGE